MPAARSDEGVYPESRHTWSFELEEVVTTFTVLFAALLSAGGDPESMDQVNRGIQRVYDAVVAADGRVDYPLLHGREDLQRDLYAYRDTLARLDLDTLEGHNRRIAVLANAYNVFTLIGVDRAWPTESVRDIRPFFGFFTRDEWTIGGKRYSLNKIEKRLLRPLDPRIHFIINCASASCPVLPPRVLTADNVEAEMEAATRSFLADEEKNRFGLESGVWQLSKIFDWYGSDWGKRKDLIAFIQRYRSDLAGREPETLTYLEYDWSLNGPTKAP